MIVSFKSRTQPVTVRLCYEKDLVRIPFPVFSTDKYTLSDLYTENLNSNVNTSVIDNDLTNLYNSVLTGGDTHEEIENEITIEYNNILNL